MKQIILLSLFSFAMLIACNQSEKKSNIENSPSETAVNSDNVVFLDMNVEGMTCTGCESTIKEGVSQLPGVVEVNADYVNGKAMVSYDSTLTTQKDISRAVEQRGYKVTSLGFAKEDELQLEPAN